MKGNTQFPQLPVVFEEGDDVDTGEGDGVGVGDGDWVEPDMVVLVKVTPSDS